MLFANKFENERSTILPVVKAKVRQEKENPRPRPLSRVCHYVQGGVTFGTTTRQKHVGKRINSVVDNVMGGSVQAVRQVNSMRYDKLTYNIPFCTPLKPPNEFALSST